MRRTKTNHEKESAAKISENKTGARPSPPRKTCSKYRSSRPVVFYKNFFLKTFAKFTKKAIFLNTFFQVDFENLLGASIS